MKKQTNKQTKIPHTLCCRIASTATSSNFISNAEKLTPVAVGMQEATLKAHSVRGKLPRWSADNVLGFTALKWVFGAKRQNTASKLPSDPNLRLLKFSFGCFFMSNGSFYLFSSWFPPSQSRGESRWSWLDQKSGGGGSQSSRSVSLRGRCLWPARLPAWLGSRVVSPGRQWGCWRWCGPSAGPRPRTCAEWPGTQPAGGATQESAGLC